jgi:hypothetical protein
MAPEFIRMAGEFNPVAGEKGITGGNQRLVLGCAPAGGRRRHGKRDQDDRKQGARRCFSRHSLLFLIKNIVSSSSLSMT